MPNLGPTELIIILVIVVAIFGAGKLANLGGALGKGVSDFRSAVRDANKDDDTEPDASAGTTAAKTEPEPKAEES